MSKFADDPELTSILKSPALEEESDPFAAVVTPEMLKKAMVGQIGNLLLKKEAEQDSK